MNVRTDRRITITALNVAVVGAVFISACSPADSNAAGGQDPDLQTNNVTATTAAAETTIVATTAPATTTSTTTTTAATTTTTTTTTTTAPAATIPEPVDVNFVYWIEESLESSPGSTGAQDVTANAIEATVRAFPDLDPPDRALALIFQNLSFLNEQLGPDVAQGYLETHGTEGTLGGLAGPSDSYFVVQADNLATLASPAGVATISHETYHLLQAQNGLSDSELPPAAVLEGSARYAESFVAWQGSAREQSLDTYLEDLWGDSEGFGSPCVVDETFPTRFTSPEAEAAITELGCDPYDPTSKRPVRAALDDPLTFANYNDWARLLHLWTAEENGRTPLMFLVDLWKYQGSFEDAWEHVYGVPYSAYESWVADLIEADEAALAQWRAERLRVLGATSGD